MKADLRLICITTIIQKRRDPRFDKLSGQLNQDLFEKSYGFLNDYKKSEMDMLRQRLKKEKDPEEAEKLKGLLVKMVQLMSWCLEISSLLYVIVGIC